VRRKVGRRCHRQFHHHAESEVFSQQIQTRSRKFQHLRFDHEFLVSRWYAGRIRQGLPLASSALGGAGGIILPSRQGKALVWRSSRVLKLIGGFWYRCMVQVGEPGHIVGLQKVLLRQSPTSLPIFHRHTLKKNWQRSIGCMGLWLRE